MRSLFARVQESPKTKGGLFLLLVCIALFTIALFGPFSSATAEEGATDAQNQLQAEAANLDSTQAAGNQEASTSLQAVTVGEIASIDDLVLAVNQGGNYKLVADLILTRQEIGKINQANPNAEGTFVITNALTIDMNNKAIKVGELQLRSFFYVKNGGSCTLTHTYVGEQTYGGLMGYEDIDTSNPNENLRNQHPLIFVEKGGSFNLETNITDVHSMRYTKGFIINQGTFTMSKSAKIVNCTTYSRFSDTFPCVDHVYLIVNAGTFDMQNGTVTNCKSYIGSSSVFYNYGYNGTAGTMIIGAEARIMYCETTGVPIIKCAGLSTLNTSGTITNCEAKYDQRIIDAESRETVIFADSVKNVEIKGGSIVNNVCGGKAGALIIESVSIVSDEPFITMSGGTIANNTCGLGGGEVFCGTNAIVDFKGGTIEGVVESAVGTCLVIEETARVSLTGTTFYGTKAKTVDRQRGGLIANKGSLVIDGSTLDGYSKEGKKTCTMLGGLIYQEGNGSIVFKSGTLKNGVASGDSQGNKGYGGAIYAAGGSVTIGGGTSSAIIDKCEADNGGGAIYMTDCYKCTLDKNALIQNCRAESQNVLEEEFGGALCLLNTRFLQIKDGATITGCNAKTDGGGVYISYTNEGSYKASITIEKNATISNCEAEGRGGGVFVGKNTEGLIGYKAAITGNTAAYGGGIALTSNAAVELCAYITGNTATKMGGGMIVVGSKDAATAPTLLINGGVIAKNTSSTNKAKDLYLDYLASSSPKAADRIQPRWDPAGNIVIEGNGSGETPVWVDRDALGTDKDSITREFLTNIHSPFVSEDETLITVVKDRDVGKTYFVKAEAIISTLDDLRKAAAKGGTYCLRDSLTLSKTVFTTPVKVGDNKEFILDTLGYTISFDGFTAGCLFSLENHAKLEIHGRGTKTAIQGIVSEDTAGSQYAGAIHVSGDSRLWLDATIIKGCTASTQTSQTGGLTCGGAITANDGTVVLANGTVIDGCSGLVGAISAIRGRVEVNGLTIKNCTALEKGYASAIALGRNNGNATMFWKNGTIEENNTSVSGASSVRVSGRATLNMKGGAICGTDGANCGACVRVDRNGKFEMTGGTLYGAVANKGGCLYTKGYTSIEGGTLMNGIAYQGGLVYSAGTTAMHKGTLENGLAYQGGLIYINKAKRSFAYIRLVDFENGTAAYGGGIYSCGRLYMTAGGKEANCRAIASPFSQELLQAYSVLTLELPDTDDDDDIDVNNPFVKDPSELKSVSSGLLNALIDPDEAAFMKELNDFQKEVLAEADKEDVDFIKQLFKEDDESDEEADEEANAAENDPGCGGVIYVQRGNMVLLSVQPLSNGYASVYGGGIFANSTAYCWIAKRIESCEAGVAGGGIYTMSNTEVKIRKSVKNCSAGVAGGGVMINGGNVMLNDGVSGNTAPFGGGICFEPGAKLTLDSYASVQKNATGTTSLYKNLYIDFSGEARTEIGKKVSTKATALSALSDSNADRKDPGIDATDLDSKVYVSISTSSLAGCPREIALATEDSVSNLISDQAGYKTTYRKDGNREYAMFTVSGAANNADDSEEATLQTGDSADVDAKSTVDGVTPRTGDMAGAKAGGVSAVALLAALICLGICMKRKGVDNE